MLAEAAELVAARQASKKTPRTYARLPRDARGEGPRHRPRRHARPLARPADDRRRRGGGRRLRAEADQRGRGRGPGDARRRPQAQARRAGGHAAAQHAAPDRGPRPGRQRGQAREDRPGRDLLLLPHAGRDRNPPDTPPPDNLDYEMWTGPAPMRPYNALVHPRGWRAFMEYGNGIVGDMCIHMLDMVRWMLDLGWPKRDQLVGRHPGATRAARRTSPTRRRPRSTSATCRSSGSTAPGATPPDPKYPWGATFYGDKGTLKAERQRLRLHPARRRRAGVHARRRLRARQVSRRTGPRRTWSSTSPRPSARHMRDFLDGDRDARQAGGRHRAGPHLDGQLHPGQPVDAARPHARRGTPARPGRRRRGGEPAAAPAVPRALGASRAIGGWPAPSRPAWRASVPRYDRCCVVHLQPPTAACRRPDPAGPLLHRRRALRARDGADPLRMWLCAGRAETLDAPGRYFVRQVANADVILLRDEEGGLSRVPQRVPPPRARGCAARRRGSSRPASSAAITAGPRPGRPARRRPPHGEGGRAFARPTTPCAGWRSRSGTATSSSTSRTTRLPCRAARGAAGEVPALANGRAATAERRVYSLKANWKLIFQNYSECLHCPIVHPLSRSSPTT